MADLIYFTNSMPAVGGAQTVDSAHGLPVASSTPTVFKTIATVAVGTETTVWTPATGKKFRLMRFHLGVSSSVTLTFKDNTAGTTIFICQLSSGTGNWADLGAGILSAAANNVLTCTSSAAANLIGTLMGTEE